MSEYQIKLGLDNAQAQDAVGRMLDGFKAAEAAALKTTQVVEGATRAEKKLGDAAAESGKRAATAAEQEALARTIATQKILAAKDRERQKNFIVATEQSAHFQRITADTDDLARSFGKLGDQGSKLFRSVGRGATEGFGLAVLAVRKYEQVLAEANRRVHDQIENLLKTKEMFRDIAAMQGKTPTDKYTIESLKSAERTGMSVTAFKEFAHEFSGAGEAARGRNISSEEMDKAAVSLARYAAVQGGDDQDKGTYGRLGGILLESKNYGQGKGASDEFIKDVNIFSKHISAGVGKDPDLVKQAVEAAGIFMNDRGGGRIADTHQLGSLVATLSMINPREVATNTRRVTRFLGGHNEKWGKMLKGMGIGEKDQTVVAMEKMFKGFESMEAKNLDPLTQLKNAGVPVEEAEIVVGSYNKRDILRQQLASPVGKITAADTNKEINERMAKDTGIQLQMVKTRNERLMAENAVKNQPALLVEELAEGNLIARGEGKDSSYGTMLDATAGLGNVEHGHKMRIDAEIRKMGGKKQPFVPEAFLRAGDVSERAGVGIELESQGKLGNKPGRSILDLNPIDPLAGTAARGTISPTTKAQNDAILKAMREQSDWLKKIAGALGDPKNQPARVIRPNGGKAAFH